MKPALRSGNGTVTVLWGLLPGYYLGRIDAHSMVKLLRASKFSEVEDRKE